MLMNRVQFQQGLPLPEFMQRFGTEGRSRTGKQGPFRRCGLSR